MSAHSVDLTGFRCTNHAPNHQALASGVFDVENPCTWCLNRKHDGYVGPAFHYVEFGRWEFPFIAESNCRNFSLILRPGTPRIDPKVWRKAREAHEHRNRIAELGRHYAAHWLAFDPADDAPTVAGTTPAAGQIVYPNAISATEFFREASTLRAELFAVRQEINAAVVRLHGHHEFRDTRLEYWIATTARALGQLTKQIDALESAQPRTRFAVVSRWAVNNVAGNAAWDSLKWVTRLVAEIVRSAA